MRGRNTPGCPPGGSGTCSRTPAPSPSNPADTNENCLTWKRAAPPAAAEGKKRKKAPKRERLSRRKHQVSQARTRKRAAWEIDRNQSGRPETLGRPSAYHSVGTNGPGHQ